MILRVGNRERGGWTFSSFLEGETLLCSYVEMVVIRGVQIWVRWKRAMEEKTE